MVIRHRLTLAAGGDDESGDVQVEISHNDREGCIETADLVWELVVRALIVKTGFPSDSVSSITVTEW
jgi:hypothetical protein